MLLTPFMFPSGLFPNALLLLCELRQWGKVVVAICQIRIVDSAIMFCHGKGAVSQQLLEHKGIPAAIHKVLSGKGVAEQVDACSGNAPPMIIFFDCASQSVFRHHFAVDRTEQIVFRSAATNDHIFRQNLHHLAAQRNRLQFSCFGVAVDNPLIRQRNIPVLNTADGSRTAAGIDQEVHNHPIPKFAEITVLCRLLQKSNQFFVCVRPFYGFLVLNIGKA